MVIFTLVVIILDCLGQVMQVLYLSRAPRTKETLPDFLKWRRVTRHPLVFLFGTKRYTQVYDTITKGLLSNPQQRRHKTCSVFSLTIVLIKRYFIKSKSFSLCF